MEERESIGYTAWLKKQPGQPLLYECSDYKISLTRTFTMKCLPFP